MTGVGTGHRPWLLRSPAEESRLLFCFPYSGCGASMYRYWPRWSGQVEVCPVQVPGRENRIREPHFGTFDALADQVCAGLTPYLDRPYALFGHCSGALMAYAVALRLTGSGLPAPDHLFVSSQPAPGFRARGGFLAMDDAELEDELVRLLQAMGSRPTRETLDLYLSVYHPDLAAARAFASREPLPPPTRITVVGWDASGVSRAGLAEWKRYGDVTFVELPGGHYDFLSAPAELTRLLTSWVPTSSTPTERREWTS